jgi:translation initiation factor IF-3
LQKTKVNQQIQAPEVRVISEDGQQIGIFPLSEALALAEEHGLDLVEISPQAKPPVTKLILYDKFRYQIMKQEQQQKKRAKKVEVKTLRLSVRIGSHDLQTKARNADGFLTEGDLVKVELRMRGREQAFVDLAEKQMKTFQESLSVPYRIEVPVKRMGSTLSMTIAPGKPETVSK